MAETTLVVWSVTALGGLALAGLALWLGFVLRQDEPAMNILPSWRS